MPCSQFRGQLHVEVSVLRQLVAAEREACKPSTGRQRYWCLAADIFIRIDTNWRHDVVGVLWWYGAAIGVCWCVCVCVWVGGGCYQCFHSWGWYCWCMLIVMWSVLCIHRICLSISYMMDIRQRETYAKLWYEEVLLIMISFLLSSHCILINTGCIYNLHIWMLFSC